MLSTATPSIYSPPPVDASGWAVSRRLSSSSEVPPQTFVEDFVPIDSVQEMVNSPSIPLTTPPRTNVYSPTSEGYQVATPPAALPVIGM